MRTIIETAKRLKAGLTTTTPSDQQGWSHHLDAPTARNENPTMDDFAAIFKALRLLYAKHADACVLLADDADRYILGTHEVRQRDGYRTWLGGVEIKKSYVSAHLMPLYIHPDLIETMTPDLRRRMQGKACLNFKRIDPNLFAQLDALIDLGIARFRADGRL
ncbi:hypothetical protein FHS31_002955 [Sphingomonas vulcanisoli]|uniref:DUF1801 domain-containing protein n=1 Tax=Sphingomonas vulcanisoli TaxID=1658060 RepID=A0ABX0TUV8_9SPHN|nr:hypothetical protein [Sphingomonas vulcanisoli]NIJ09323.1 hypothetical protein [Sphingomonas vulcanisoli]